MQIWKEWILTIFKLNVHLKNQKFRHSDEGRNP